jgi:sugar phosphate isomerase/epimerase
VTRLGLGSYACAWAIGVAGFEMPSAPMTVFDFVRFASELGLHLVQIADNLPLHLLSSTERHALRAEARTCGVDIEVGTRGIETEHLREYIDIAQEYDSPILRVVVDTATHHPTPDEIIALVGSALPELTRAEITLAIENHDRFKVATLAGILETLDHPNVGICLDTVNSFGALEGPDLVVATLGPYVVSLHVKEFIVRRLRHNMGFEVTGVPAGQGMLDTASLLKNLYGFGHDFNAIIELWPEPEAAMSTTIAKESDWVRQSTAYLRTMIKD